MILIASTISNSTHGKELMNFLSKQKIKTTNRDFASIKELTLFVEKEYTKYERVIILDEIDTFPFMYLTKIKGLVVATITDYYSAYMTPLHNNTKIIVIPTSIVTQESINQYSLAFVNAQFEGGRHMVRIDLMLNEFNKKGGK